MNEQAFPPPAMADLIERIKDVQQMLDQRVDALYEGADEHEGIPELRELANSVLLATFELGVVQRDLEDVVFSSSKEQVESSLKRHSEIRQRKSSRKRIQLLQCTPPPWGSS